MKSINPGLDTLLSEAVEIADPSQRDAYLRNACGSDGSKLADLQSMVRDFFAAGSIVDRPAAVAPTVAAELNTDITRQIGPYKLREMLGEGGMGSVYVAEQERPVRRKVALKIIKPGMGSREVIARFESERQALALMDHPNIARVLDAGTTENGLPYFVMELVRGVPITEHCDAQKLGTRQRLELFIQVCQAVQHAHQKGIIHRDIKPSNVIVAVHDVTPVVKVIDFGVAKAIGQQLTDNTLYTAFSQMVGTPLYMSPEQAGQSSLDIDTRSDVYSLGVLLYELLTGNTPFDKDTLKQVGLDEMRRIIREVDPPKPSARVSTLQAEVQSTIAEQRKIDPRKLSQQIRGELDWIVMKAIEKDRNRRYETTNALAADVRRFLDGDQVQACPPTRRYRFSKFAWRNRAILASTSLVMMAILFGVTLAAWQALQANRARRNAESNFLLAQRAVDETITKIAEDPRLEEADFHDLRQDLLASAVPFYQEFILQNSNVTQLKIEHGRAYGRLGKIQAEMGQHDAARENYQKMKEVFSALADANPEEAVCRIEEATALWRLSGQLRALGNIAEAEAKCRLSVKLLKSLSFKTPNSTEVRIALSRAYMSLGTLLHDQGDDLNAEAECRESLKYSDELRIEFPTKPEYRNSNATQHSMLCFILTDLGKMKDAEAEARIAVEIMDALATDFPKVTRHRSSLASFHSSLARVLDRLGSPDAGAETLAALQIYQSLADEFPRVPSFRSKVGVERMNNGLSLCKERKFSEAFVECGAAVKIFEDLVATFPKVHEFRRQVAYAQMISADALLHQGKADEAELAYRKANKINDLLVAEFPAMPEMRVDAARTHGMLGRLLDGMGKHAEAEPEYRRSIDYSFQPNGELPSRPADLNVLAISHTNLAATLGQLKRFSEANEASRTAAQLLETVLQAFPENSDVRLGLANARRMIAGSSYHQNKLAEAEQEIRNAIDIGKVLVDRFPDNANYHQELADSYYVLMLCLTKQCHWADVDAEGNMAFRIEEEIVNRFPKVNRRFGFYNLACCYSLASATKDLNEMKSEEYAAKAVALLRLAYSSAGWNNIETTDSDLDPIREREDFGRLKSDIRQSTLDNASGAIEVDPK